MKTIGLIFLALMVLAGCGQNRVPENPHVDESDTRSLTETGMSEQDAKEARAVPASTNKTAPTTGR